MSSITTTKIGSRINTLREQKELTQEALSDRSGLEQPVICQLEKGQRRFINPQHLEKIASALEVPVSALYGIGESEDEAFVFSLPDFLRKLFVKISALPAPQQRKIGEVIEKLLELS